MWSGYELYMNTSYLLDDLLKLPEHERAELAQALTHSLVTPSDTGADTGSWERKWTAESKRRFRYLRGISSLVLDSDVGFAAMVDRLRPRLAVDGAASGSGVRAVSSSSNSRTFKNSDEPDEVSSDVDTIHVYDDYGVWDFSPGSALDGFRPTPAIIGDPFVPVGPGNEPDTSPSPDSEPENVFGSDLQRCKALYRQIAIHSEIIAQLSKAINLAEFGDMFPPRTSIDLKQDLQNAIDAYHISLARLGLPALFALERMHVELKAEMLRMARDLNCADVIRNADTGL